MENEEAWKLFKVIMWSGDIVLEGMSKIYFDMMSVDIWNIERKVSWWSKWKEHWEKWWRQPKTITPMGLWEETPKGLDSETPQVEKSKPQDKISKDKIREDKIKQDKIIYGEVFRCTPDERQKLVNLFGEQGTQNIIQRFDNYVISRGLQNHYKDHYRAVLDWNRDKKQETKQEEPAKKSNTVEDNVPDCIKWKPKLAMSFFVKSMWYKDNQFYYTSDCRAWTEAVIVQRGWEEVFEWACKI
jgi:hypothetical protein